MPATRSQKKRRAVRQKNKTVKNKKAYKLEKFVNLILDGDVKGCLALIKSGNYDPGFISSNGNTLLIWACQYLLYDVALKLIETGTAKPEHVNKHGDTSLMWVCKDFGPQMHAADIKKLFKKKEEVVISLLKTGKARPENINKDR